jgi:hypothetical protein
LQRNKPDYQPEGNRPFAGNKKRPRSRFPSGSVDLRGLFFVYTVSAATLRKIIFFIPSFGRLQALQR